MNILFDHQAFSLQKYGGISRYHYELVNGMNILSEHQASVSVAWSDNAYIQRPVPLPDKSFRGRGTLLYKVNQLYSLKQIRQKAYDIFHPTYYDPYFLDYLGNRPFVITLHDMTHERLSSRFPELIIDKFTTGKHLLVRKADAVIAVSDYTKRDAIELLGIDPARVHVVHHASSLKVHKQSTDKVENVAPYLLFVGNRGHYKNFKSLLKAVTLLPRWVEVRIICAGGGAFTQAEHKEIHHLKLTNRVTQRAFQTDDELATLYSSAIAFVFPSFYEGFGIPVLEAFSCGCPCLLSKASSLPEIADRAALYFEPDQPESLSQMIELIVSDSITRQQLIESGYDRLKQFNWPKAVESTLKVYGEIHP